MQSQSPQLPLSEVMPLFSPIYQPAPHALSAQLKHRIQAKTFDSTTNALAEQILLKQPSNYNGWYCKKMYILSLPAQLDIEHEFSFANQCLGDKAKSFQVWQQKRFLLQLHNTPEREMAVSREVIERIDHKNYHAWSFRTWLVELQGWWEQELEFAEEMIEEDCFNNSAWTYRFFLVAKETEGKDGEVREAVAKREVEFVLESIKEERSNRASWNYLRGLFPSIKLNSFSTKNSQRTTLIKSFERFPQIEENCQQFWQEVKQNSESCSKEDTAKLLAIEREVLCTLVHIYSQGEENKHYAESLCDQLAEKEKQRAFYWKWVKEHL